MRPSLSTKSNIQEISPRTLARIAAIIGLLEGQASVWGQLRIPDRLVASTDPAATATNILGNESLFRFGLLLSDWLSPLMAGELPMVLWLVVWGAKDQPARPAVSVPALA